MKIGGLAIEEGNARMSTVVLPKDFDRLGTVPGIEVKQDDSIVTVLVSMSLSISVVHY